MIHLPTIISKSMKFCPKCDDRMSGDLCTTCDKKKLPARIKFSDYSNQKINSCDKGCGGKIYFDEDFKTEDGKFIPIDKNSHRPHKCKRIPVRKKLK